MSAQSHNFSAVFSARRILALSMSLLVMLTLSSCSDTEKLPSPGAQGLVVVHMWDEAGGLPAYMQAERVTQEGSVFEELTFLTVLMRLPGQGGVVYVSAPCALYKRDAAEEIVLSALPDKPIDGPVRFLGTYQGDVIIGRAEKAVFEEKTHRMRLDNVEIVFQGLRQRTAFVKMGEDRIIPIGKLERLPDAPALTAAMGALPKPLVLPPLRGYEEK